MPSFSSRNRRGCKWNNGREAETAFSIFAVFTLCSFNVIISRSVGDKEENRGMLQFILHLDKQNSIDSETDHTWTGWMPRLI